MILFASKEEKELVQRLRKLEPLSDMTEQVVKLKKQIADLEITKGKVEEANARERRELTHMIGLEKKRQEFEIDKAKSETSLKIREGNLAADTKRFEAQLKFNTDRFEAMEKYLKEMMTSILGRLPNIDVEVHGSLKGKK